MLRPSPNHVHYSTVLEWHDGDTVKLDTDQDYRTHNQDWHRLFGVDTPELNTPEGKEALRFVQNWAPPGTRLVIVSYKRRDRVPTDGEKEKYGRWLAEVWLADGPAEQPSLNETLVRVGISKPYFGEKK